MTRKPIFIIGCPRSGTTITLDIFARHEKLAWVSNILNNKPLQVEKAMCNRIFDLPFFGEALYVNKSKIRDSRFLPDRIKQYLPIPVEPWGFWENYLKNFRWEPGGKILPIRHTYNDVSSREISTLQSVIKAICIYQGKERFLSKYTDFPRINYLAKAFPDAIFIHIIRDGRAVAASYYERIKSGKFGTWNEREWWVKGWPRLWQDEWKNQYNSPLSFVAYQWKFFVDSIQQEAETIPPQQYLEVRYRDLVNNPHSTFDRIFDFCDLNRSKKVQSYLDVLKIKDMNYKWREKHTTEEIMMLNRIIQVGKYISFLD